VTYFAFLALFLVLPIAVLTWLLRHERRAAPPRRRTAVHPAAAIALTAAIAVVYTTPWDNYLVATAVWSYDASLVSGLILGYVPIEEYLFFVLQTVLTGLWWLLLANRSAAPGHPARIPARLRLAVSLPWLLVWLAACFALGSGAGPARYTALLLAWALPPILIQLAYGADLLWKARRIILPAILTATLYYSVADILAVSTGTWSFHPDLIVGWDLGPLPVEEVLFFLLTNVLIVFSVSLLTSPESMARLRRGIRRVRASWRRVDRSDPMLDSAP
jgi:lycopene cyclase domain-containing protein